MIYSLVYYPEIDTTQINYFRKKYDPQVDLIQPHITIMFPVSDFVGEDKLVDHVGNVLNERQRFTIRLHGLYKSWDDCLFLLVQEGKEAIADLHAQIYTGLLADLRQTEFPYVPHLTLGMFANNRSQYAHAVDEANRLDLNYRCVLDKLHLVKIDDQRSGVVSSREFLLV